MNRLRPGQDQSLGLRSPDFFDEVDERRISDIWRYCWRVVWNRRWIILGFFVLTLMAAAAKAYFVQPMYRATGTIVIEPARQQVIVGVQGFTPSDQTAYEGQLIQMQLDILQSRKLAEKVINKLRLWEYPESKVSPAASNEGKEKQRTLLIDEFLRRLQVDAPADAGQRVIRLSYSSTDPRLAAQVLNTLFESFIDYNRESNTEAVEFAAGWLTKQLAELEDKLEAARGELLKYQQNNELIYTGNAEQNPTLERFTQLNEELAEAEATRIKAEILYRRSRQGGEIEPSPESGKDSGLDSLKEDRWKLEAQLSQWRTIYQDQAPPVKQAERQLADLNNRIKQAEQAQQRSQLEHIKNEYEIAKDRVETLSQEVEKQRAEMLKQNADALQFGLLKSKTEADEKLFQMLSERLREAGLMRSLTPNSNIRVVDRAEVPLMPANSNGRALVRWAVVGLVLGIGLAFLLEFLDDNLKTTEDVEALLRLPNLGAIPLVNGEGERSQRAGKQPKDSPLVIPMSHGEGDPVFREAYRTLRTSVLLSSTNRPPRTIAIISNEAGVGKTTISVNMAIALAQAGKRVLLIDADMRRPGCAQALGTDNTAGLSTHLSFEAKPVAIDHDCAVPGLDLLPSGPVPPNPSELLSSEKVHALIESMAAQYEHVIIDTPPVALVSDALILAAVVDGVILVVRSGQTSRRGILRVKDSLRTVNARILGVALNAINLSRHQYRYESRYGYGYDYSHGRRSKKVEEYHRA